MIREILEKYIDNPYTSKEWHLAAQGYMPLTPSLMKKFEENINEAYHVTDEAGIKNLKKIQGQKKQISSFTKGSEGLSQGARNEPEYLVVLSGISSFELGMDASTFLSRNGYRWLNPLESSDSEYVVNNKFKVPIIKKMVKYFGVKDRFDLVSKVEYLKTGKEKQLFVKWFFDESKKLITSKLLKEIKKSYLKNNNYSWNNNEQLLYNIKIKNVKIILENSQNIKNINYPTEYPEREEYIKKIGLKFGGYITQKEIEKLGK